MKNKKPLLISLIGARPQFIKIAPLAEKLSKKFRHIIVHSGQHYDRKMSDVFFKQLDIPKAKYNLSVGSGHHGEMTAAIMARFEKLLLRLKPDMVLVFGDTNSTLAGALTAAKLRIPLAHVEAGLRSFNRDMPEEINRLLTDNISSLLFCPTLESMKNLKNEGSKKGIIHSGDLMYELIDISLKNIKGNKKILSQYKLEPGNYILMTMHRAGNVDTRENLGKMLEIIEKAGHNILFPMHPRTLKNIKKYKLLSKFKKLDNLRLTEPLSYLDNLSLMYFARAVMTDSGGVQKESVFLGTPCLTLRNETEWVETLKWGNYLVGLSKRKIISKLKKAKKPLNKVNYKIRGKKPTEIIVSSLQDFLR